MIEASDRSERQTAVHPCQPAGWVYRRAFAFLLHEQKEE
jgi:hypothetical protein